MKMWVDISLNMKQIPKNKKLDMKQIYQKIGGVGNFETY